MRRTSQRRLTPEWSRTRARTSSPSASRSEAVALPVLIRKLQCIGETCAPPTLRPRHPAASISFHAERWPGVPGGSGFANVDRSEEHTSELQSQSNLVCRLLLEKK